MRTISDPGPRRRAGFDIYWRFACERQMVYLRRLDGAHGPELTEDGVLREHRFTNAYRASDRVSQYLIRNVIYDRARSWEDVFVRVLTFKMFNRVDTWEAISADVGEIGVESLLGGAVDAALAKRAAGHPIYNAAYIMPPPRHRPGAKFERHLALIKEMVATDAAAKIADSQTLGEAFAVLSSYDSIGPFLAYQFAIDLNYSEHLDFSENEFVEPGPGALRGIRKCFALERGESEADAIKWVVDYQEQGFADLGLPWRDLWGRRLHLIDAQNLFCEVDKYTRRTHPELSEFAPGQRIKQRYMPLAEPLTAWFPPKWNLNEAVPTRFSGVMER